jgi:hypothetical protein
VSRKYTFAIENASPTPVANTAKTIIAITTSGRNGRGFAPTISRTMVSTAISIAHVNIQDATVATMRAPRGKCTFLMRFSFPTRAPIDPLTTFVKNVQGSSMHSSHSAKMSRPDGSPGSGWMRMMNAKTTV